MKQYRQLLGTLLIALATTTTVTAQVAGTTVNLSLARNTGAVLKNGTDGLGFYPVTATTVVKANSAYVAAPRQLLIDLATLDSPLTGIREVQSSKFQVSSPSQSEATQASSAKSYDLSGRPATDHHAQPIVIRDGKKVLNKKEK